MKQRQDLMLKSYVWGEARARVSTHVIIPAGSQQTLGTSRQAWFCVALPSLLGSHAL